MRIYEINPSLELKTYLSANVKVKNDAIAVYTDSDAPSNIDDEDFIIIEPNGDPKYLTNDKGVISGFLALSLYCRLFEDGKVRSNRVSKILSQFDSTLDGYSSTNYFYKIDLERPIMPTTVDYGTGYSVTILNIKWRTL